MVTTAGLRFVVGGVGVGGASNVRVYDADGGPFGDVDASDLFDTTGPTLATADVTGDGVEDVVVGLGDGVVNWVRVVDGRRSRPPSTAVRSTPSPVG
ncbi:hypothetical protein J0H58_07440 [bacterium]|nr:hypothetical protein [bacterium]